MAGGFVGQCGDIGESPLYGLLAWHRGVGHCYGRTGGGQPVLDQLRSASGAPIMITKVVLAVANACQLSLEAGSPGGAWPEITVKPCVSSARTSRSCWPQATSARRRSLSTAAAESFAAAPRYETPRIRSIPIRTCVADSNQPLKALRADLHASCSTARCSTRHPLITRTVSRSLSGTGDPRSSRRWFSRGDGRREGTAAARSRHAGSLTG
jgi:hypothetical protein